MELDEILSNGDIRATLTISAQEARKGTTRLVNLPNGQRANVQVPAGSQAEQILVLPGQGEVPAPGVAAGNLYLTLAVQPSATESSPDLNVAASPIRVSPPIQAPAPAPFRDIFAQTPVTPSSYNQQPWTNTPAPDPFAWQEDLPVNEAARIPPVSMPRLSRRGQISPLVAVILIVVLAGGGFSIYRSITSNWHDTRPWPTQATVVSADQNPNTSPWQTQTSGTSQRLITVAWSRSQFVVVGDNGTILTSPDGYTWTSQNSGITQNLWGVASSNSLLVVVGLKGTILTSPDGYTWTSQISGTSQDLWNVAWSGSLFVVAGSDGTILTSPDGQTWTAQNSGTALILDGTAWSGSLFVVIGDKGTLLTSPDAHTWTARNSGTAQLLENVVWLNAQFMLVGENGTILTSLDGFTWTSQNSGTSQTLYAIAWSGSEFVITGNDGTILTSPYGYTWSSQNSGTSQQLWSVVRSRGVLVIVGDNGTILTISAS